MASSSLDALLDGLQPFGDGRIILAVLVVAGRQAARRARRGRRSSSAASVARECDFLRVDAPEFAEVAVAEARARLDPAPAFGADGFGEGGELVRHHLVEQRRVLRVAGGAVVEQVAAHRASGGLVGFKADEAHAAVGGRDLAFGQRPADGARVGPMAVAGGEDALLRRVVVGEGEGLHLLQPDVAGAVGVEDGGGDAAELQALPDDVLGHAEAGGDGRDGCALVDEVAERLELVGRVHGDAHDVLGQADLHRVGVAPELDAGHQVVVRELAASGEQHQRAVTTLPGDDGDTCRVQPCARRAT